MQIYDFQNLVDKELLEVVSKHHPFYHDIGSEVKTLTVQEKGNEGPKIDMDEQCNIYLSIHPILRPSKRDVYILYHEFGHIADRINPWFRYYHRKRLQLDHWQEKNFLEIWNVYIDSRLNHFGLFCLPSGGYVQIAVDGVKYTLPRNDISTYLLEAACHLSQRGIQKPGAIVNDLWKHPDRFLTFEDLLDLVW